MIACQRFTPILKELYQKLKAKSSSPSKSNSSSSTAEVVEDFEIVFCSMDRTVEEWKSYTRDMPWWCLPHHSTAIGRLANLYGAMGVPQLVVIDRNGTIVTNFILVNV